MIESHYDSGLGLYIGVESHKQDKNARNRCFGEYLSRGIDVFSFDIKSAHKRPKAVRTSIYKCIGRNKRLRRLHKTKQGFIYRHKDCFYRNSMPDISHRMPTGITQSDVDNHNRTDGGLSTILNVGIRQTKTIRMTELEAQIQ